MMFSRMLGFYQNDTLLVITATKVNVLILFHVVLSMHSNTFKIIRAFALV